MQKKQIEPEDIKSEDINRIIDKSFYGVDDSNKKSVFKLFTFLLLFISYILLSITVQHYIIKLMIITFGLALLVFLFQEIVLPSFRQKKKKSLLES
jgi:hypothetical protein